MLFTKSGADNITVINPQGVRSAQCVAKFDISEQPSQEPMVNVSMVSMRMTTTMTKTTTHSCYEFPDI